MRHRPILPESQAPRRKAAPGCPGAARWSRPRSSHLYQCPAAESSMSCAASEIPCGCLCQRVLQFIRPDRLGPPLGICPSPVFLYHSSGGCLSCRAAARLPCNACLPRIAYISAAPRMREVGLRPAYRVNSNVANQTRACAALRLRTVEPYCAGSLSHTLATSGLCCLGISLMASLGHAARHTPHPKHRPGSI